MNTIKLVKRIIAGVFLAGGITFGILAGIKTTKTNDAAEKANYCTQQMHDLMDADLTYQYNIPGTENYKLLQSYEKDRDEANLEFQEAEVNLPLFASLAFVCGFGLLYLGVDALRKR